MKSILLFRFALTSQARALSLAALGAAGLGTMSSCATRPPETDPTKNAPVAVAVAPGSADAIDPEIARLMAMAAGAGAGAGERTDRPEGRRVKRRYPQDTRYYSY